MNSSRLWLIGAACAASAQLAMAGTGDGLDGLRQVGVTANQTDQLISGPAAWLAAALLVCLLGRGVIARMSRKRTAGSAPVGARRPRP